MQLCAVLLVAVVPILTYCQIDGQNILPTPAPNTGVGGPQNGIGVGQSLPDGEQEDVPWTPWQQRQVPLDSNTKTCKHAPMMPQMFFAKRKWLAWTNTIVFTDRFGHEFGFVRSWLLDWKNPFGYAGADFYLKAVPDNGKTGVWRLNPKPGLFGWATQTRNSNTADNLKGEAATWSARNEYMRKHGNDNYDVETQKNFLRATYGDTQNRLLAYMHGEHNPKWFFDWFGGNPFSEHVYLKDCRDKSKMEANDHTIYLKHAGRDAQYYTKVKNEENTLHIADFSIPTREIVRLRMKAPCVPFPPFCQQMGAWNWFIHNEKWSGEITQPGYNESLGNNIVNIHMTAGGATDMRFLALYSAFQFSNTRFSPIMEWIMLILLIVFCCCCTQCCYACCQAPRKLQQELGEESHKLMETIETEFRAETEPKQSGWLACCSRQGRTVAPLPAAPSGHGGGHGH